MVTYGCPPSGALAILTSRGEPVSTSPTKFRNACDWTPGAINNSSKQWPACGGADGNRFPTRNEQWSVADEGTEKRRHACADGGRVGIRPGPGRAEPCLDAALVASVQLLGSGVASSRGSMPGKGVDASVSLASCWLCLASIAAGHRQRRDAAGPGHTGRPMGTRQQRNSRQKQRREVNRRTPGEENNLPPCKPKTVPGQDKRTALSWCCRSHGGDGWPAVVDTPRPPSPWLAEMQLAQLSPGDLSTVAGFWEAR